MQVRRIATTAVTAVAVSLGAASAAEAARAPIDLDAAQTKVERYANAERDAHNAQDRTPYSDSEVAAAKADGFEYGTPALIEWVTVECDEETRYRAVCDVEYQFSDGSTDVEVVNVLKLRKGGLRLRSEGFVR